MGDFEKVIDVCVKAPKITEEVLKTALRDLMSGKKQKRGKITFGELAKRSTGKLESIEITDNNIKSFLSVARKYDVDFALKRDRSTDPPTYHCFFASRDTENFKRAFTEYAAVVKQKHSAVYTLPRKQIRENAKRINREQNVKSKEKLREKTKSQNQSR